MGRQLSESKELFSPSPPELEGVIRCFPNCAH